RDHGCGRFRHFLDDRRGFFVALHEHALLAHLDLDGACAPRGAGCLDLGGLLARERDLLLRFANGAVLLAQVVEQLGLVLLRQHVAGILAGKTGPPELLQQSARRDLELARELFDGRVRHMRFSCFLLYRCCPTAGAGVADGTVAGASSNQCARAFMMRSVARSSGMPVISTSSSVARSASASRVVTPCAARALAISVSMPSSDNNASSTFSTLSSRTMASVRSALRARLRSSLTVSSSNDSISSISLMGTYATSSREVKPSPIRMSATSSSTSSFSMKSCRS